VAKRVGQAPPRELITILDFIRFATTRFVEAGLWFGHGTPDPAEEAIFLVGEALHLAPDRIDAFLPARLTAAERKTIFNLIETRVRTRKPAAYLLRRAYLQSVPFYVDERVIVPRSYIAELLAGDVFEEGGLLVDDPSAVTRVLDLCTGSGCLAILACRTFANARVDAVDLSPKALEVAKINVAEHDLEERITLFKGDLFEPLGDTRYDLILTNPPYVDADAMKKLPPEYRHEPKLALAGGPDGLDLVRRILAQAPRHLTPKGGLLCEIGRGREALEQSEPTRTFLWLDTAESAGEVFWLSAADLDVS
jgi:ribosomal protein L3 glutamine methyltransferase